MFIYIFVFLLSALMLFFSEKIKNPIIRKIVVLFSLLPPIILAAIRSPGIGTDVEYYAIPHFRKASSCGSFHVFIRKFNVSFTSEPLYALIVYMASRVTNNYHIVLFAFQTIMTVFMYLGFRNLNKHFNVPIWLGMLLYYLMYYNVSLNILRQSMAVSVVFYAVSFLFENKKLNYFIAIVLAFWLHGSAVIGLAFFPMYLLLKRIKNGFKLNDIRRIIIFLFIVSGVALFLDKLVRIVVSLGLLRGNALNYLSDGKFASNYISTVSVAVYLFLLILYLIHIHFMYQRKLEANFFIMVSFIMFMCSFGSLISVYISRVCYYFIPLQAFALASVQNCYKKNSKIVWSILVTSIVFVTWVIFFIIKNNHETYPYAVDINLFIQ